MLEIVLCQSLVRPNFRNFQTAIRKAEEACCQSGYDVSDHFAHVRKMVTISSRAKHQIEDIHISRYGCYLVIQNSDTEKPMVALGQTYFTIQTRRQELAEVATQAGVVTSKDSALFQDHGYAGLYNGLRAKDIHARKNLKREQKILDYMNSSELAANMFRVTQTEEKIRREGITDKAKANEAHRRMGQRVRQFIAEEGGTMPEAQPTPTKSIQRLQRETQKRIEQHKGGQQPSLFDDESSREGER